MAALASVVMAPGLFAADLWVDRNSFGGPCSDLRSKETVTRETPWCTLAKAAPLVQPGDTVWVREGVYNEVQSCPLCGDTAVIQAVVSGTQDRPIRFIAEGGEPVVLAGDSGAILGIQVAETGPVVPSYVEFRGFEIRDFSNVGVVVSDSHDIVLKGLKVSGCGQGAVGIYRSNRVTLEDSQIHNNPMAGWTSSVQIWLCGSGNVVRGNWVWENTDEDPRETEGHGISVDQCGATGDVLVENNVIWANEGMCIAVFQSDGATIRNNTCWKNGLGRPGTREISIIGESIRVHNNIAVAREGGMALVIDDPSYPSLDLSTISVSHNLVFSFEDSVIVGWPPWQTGTLQEYQLSNDEGWGEGSIQGDPNLESLTIFGFKPSEGSPVVDAGFDGQSSPSDVFGFTRPLDGDGDGVPAIDIGAHEIGGIFKDGFERGLHSWDGVL